MEPTGDRPVGFGTDRGMARRLPMGSEPVFTLALWSVPVAGATNVFASSSALNPMDSACWMRPSAMSSLVTRPPRALAPEERTPAFTTPEDVAVPKPLPARSVTTTRAALNDRGPVRVALQTSIVWWWARSTSVKLWSSQLVGVAPAGTGSVTVSTGVEMVVMGSLGPPTYTGIEHSSKFIQPGSPANACVAV